MAAAVAIAAGPTRGQPALGEVELTAADFQLVIEIAHREAGLVVHPHKEAMIRGRLTRRVRELGLSSIASYCALLRSPRLGDELPGFLNALTTNHTAFYREAHHFAHLEQVALPTLIPDGPQSSRRFRIWCAASSSGEEPYTIAATVDAYGRGRNWPDLRILATDVDTDVLDRAGKALYPASAAQELDTAQRMALQFEPTTDAGAVRIGERLRRYVTFNRLNIIETWPVRGPFDIIFCRNMLIYFDQDTKKSIIHRFTALLRPGGFLYLGHSEALPHAFPHLEPCGRTIYRRL
jgi:chemotaxis protein methyltransferase CheR